MSQGKIAAACRSGLLATFAALTCGYWLPGIGLPTLDFPTWNGNLVVPVGTSAAFGWSVGLVHTFGLGVVAAIAYAAAVQRQLPGPGWMRGILWGVVLGLVTGLTVLPLLYGAGPFGVDWDGGMPVSLAVFHVVWGVGLGLSMSSGVD